MRVKPGVPKRISKKCLYLTQSGNAIGGQVDKTFSIQTLNEML